MTEKVFIIEFHEAILIYNLDNNILCPMLIKIYDVKVNGIPKYLTDNPTD